MENRNNAIDSAKYIAAIFVIAVHTFLTYPIDNICTHLFINGLGRIAVPFFFCCSGYFIAKKGIGSEEVVFSFSKKQLKQYAFLSAIYIPITFIQMIFEKSLTAENVVNYVHISIVQGTFIHLWYFPAIIFSIVSIHFLMKKISLKRLILLFIPIYTLGLLGDGYSGIVETLPNSFKNLVNIYDNVFMTTRNGFFMGIPFVLMGIFIYTYKENIKVKKYVFLLVFSLLFLLIEVNFLRIYDIAKDYNLTIFIVPTTYFLFCILKSIDIPKIKFNFRKSSVLLYEYHLMFYGLVLGAMQVFNMTIFNVGMYRFSTVFILTQAFAFIVIQKQNVTSINMFNNDKKLKNSSNDI